MQQIKQVVMSCCNRCSPEYMCNRYEILKLVALDFLKSENFCLKFYATLFFIATILLCCKTKLSPVYDENVGLCLQITNR